MLTKEEKEDFIKQKNDLLHLIKFNLLNKNG